MIEIANEKAVAQKVENIHFARSTLSLRESIGSSDSFSVKDLTSISDWITEEQDWSVVWSLIYDLDPDVWIESFFDVFYDIYSKPSFILELIW